MNASDDRRQRIDRYFDDGLSREELAALEQLLQSDPQAAAMFVRAARIDSALRDELATDHDAAELEALFHREEEIGALPVIVPFPSAPRAEDPAIWSLWSRWIPSLVLIAAAVLIGIAILTPKPQDEPPQLAKVVAGKILVENKPVAEVPFDRWFEVAGRPNSTLELADGSKVVLQVESRAMLHRPEGEVRQRLELQRGQATFDVPRAEGSFRVETATMRLIVAGTEFGVRVIPAAFNGERRVPERTEVSVSEGRVAVQPGAGEAVVLSAGQRRMFPAEGRDNPRPKAREAEEQEKRERPPEQRERPMEPRHVERPEVKREEPKREEPRRDGPTREAPTREAPKVERENAERSELRRREEELRREQLNRPMRQRTEK